MTDAEGWVSTTHDWTRTVDRDHLEAVRSAARVAPAAVEDLVLEVLAYADEEAESQDVRGTVVVTVHEDGSVSVADDGRGTDTRRDAGGRAVRKPVMATQDLRCADPAAAPVLPGGRARGGMSTVAAVCTWLDHTNHRRDGAWTQRYELGEPQDGLVELPAADRTGTTVRLLPDPRYLRSGPLDVARLDRFPHLAVTVRTTAP
ncbi:ATP-binding protein [Cellulosimicrobium marinum]|uniref:ATP-binding protein n=1 Tax=Cellulosimicrobium marinum TaxID=1638992 RepID=UPI001E651DFC|nr:ATP-binding protein [Cellulosimicrobium marinum]MCB7138229.1 ATP-binding protein [Cellulosimicrobium marinum]